MKFVSFLIKNQIGGKNLNLKETDWNDFIEKYDGISCQSMCQTHIPMEHTIKLFGNKLASHHFCKWCQKN